MGLAQRIIFKSEEKEKMTFLSSLNYLKVDERKYHKVGGEYEIEIFIEDYGMYIHRSGDYFHEFGMLIENLGSITSSIIIEDK